MPGSELEPGIRRTAIDGSGTDNWDTGLLTFLLEVSNHCGGLHEMRHSLS